MKKIEDDITNPPDEITLNITLKGRGAARYNLVSKVLEHAFGESPEEIAKYLIRLGAEQELMKLFGTIAAIKENVKE